MIANMPRFAPAQKGLELLEMMVADQSETIIGLGCEYEHGSKPEEWLEVYQLAKAEGFHLCGHTGQVESPEDLAYCLDKLGFERIDHGYTVLLDDDLVSRCVEEKVHFTVCPAITQIGRFPFDFGLHPIREMIRRGLEVSYGSDDPMMIESDLALDYQLAADYWGYGPELIKELLINGLKGSWLDEGTRQTWIEEWSQEIDEMIPGIQGALGPSFKVDNITRKWEVKAAIPPEQMAKPLLKFTVCLRNNTMELTRKFLHRSKHWKYLNGPILEQFSLDVCEKFRTTCGFEILAHKLKFFVERDSDFVYGVSVYVSGGGASK